MWVRCIISEVSRSIPLGTTPSLRQTSWRLAGARFSKVSSFFRVPYSSAMASESSAAIWFGFFPSAVDPELGCHTRELLDIPQLVAGRLVDRHLPEDLHEVAAVIRMGCGTRGDHPA